MLRWLALASLIGAVGTGYRGWPAASQTSGERAAWNRPFQPFHLIGNIHYVGATGVSAFLITTPAGSVLLDGGLPETASQIAGNIADLGFRLSDVKYLLNSHAHFDHAGGLAEVKRLSSAMMVASDRDAQALRSGSPDMPALVVDRVIRDGETVRLGDTALTAHVTPGHTKGCTTWTTTTTERGRAYTVIFYCSTSVVDRLVGNTQYPEIVADYERTFSRLRTMSSDVFLGPHPAFFDMEAKRQCRALPKCPIRPPGSSGMGSGRATVI
ncbi:MAG: subclass B3 metallo-beta-lactamase [Acidobacteria bacterium]|nr:subclass B3 metallo-beta-lactamase [Acidobacteriota bacterium]MCA1652294.1 subclass B3 metallo-beta-lactamase [Acidobacteriota bacterium]